MLYLIYNEGFDPVQLQDIDYTVISVSHVYEYILTLLCVRAVLVSLDVGHATVLVQLPLSGEIIVLCVAQQFHVYYTADNGFHNTFPTHSVQP